MSLLETFANGILAANNAIRAARYGSPTRPGSWVVPVDHGPGGVEVLGDDVDPLVSYARAVESNPIAWALVNKLVRELSTLGVDVVRRKRDHHKAFTGKVERVHGTTLEDVIQEPAPGCSVIDLLEWLYMPWLVEGNGTIGKWRPDGKGTTPKGIVPLDWRFMAAFARPGGPVELWLSSQMGFAEPRELLPSEVVHLAWRAPSAGALGVAPLSALANTYKIDDAAVRFLQASLRNGARPLGALVTPGELDAVEAKKMDERVNKRHAGVDRAFRIAILSGGLKWERMSFSAAEAELDATRARNREEFCVAYDVRWSQVADPPQGSAGVDPAANARDLHRTLRPMALKGMSVLQRQLVDPEPEWRSEDLALRANFSELLRGSPQEEANRAVHLYTGGLISADEGRVMVGEPETGEEKNRVLHTPHAQLDPGSKDGRAQPPSDNSDADRNRLNRGPDGD